MKGNRDEKGMYFLERYVHVFIMSLIFDALTLLKVVSEAAFQDLALVYVKVWQTEVFVFANMGIAHCRQIVQLVKRVYQILTKWRN